MYSFHRFYEIVGGTDKLPKAFVPELRNNILYNARVNRIQHTNGTVIAHYLSAGKDIAVSGDCLLLTATATSTSFIKFIPNLDPDKREAIRTIHYKGATKIILVFQRPFWEDEGIHGGTSITDLPSGHILYPSHNFDSGLGVLIASYTGGDSSRKLLGLNDEECTNQSLSDVAEIHGDYVRDLYIEGFVKRWTTDSYSHGAYSLLLPYQLANLRDPIVRPTNNLFFAGEHTNYPHGWIDTAIKSAVEAVRCITDNVCYPDL